MHGIRALTIVGGALFLAAAALAAPPKNGDFYPGWGNQGKFSDEFLGGQSSYDWYYPSGKLLLLPDQSVVVADQTVDQFDPDNPKYHMGLLQLGPAGQLGASFGFNGYWWTGNGQQGGNVDAAALDTGGGILLIDEQTICRFGQTSGFLTPFAGSQEACVAIIGTPALAIRASVVQPDGLIVLAGSSGPYGFVMRLKADGAPDPTFSSGMPTRILPAAYTEVAFHAVTLTSTLKIVAAGTATLKSNGASVPFLARFNALGQTEAWPAQNLPLISLNKYRPSTIASLAAVDDLQNLDDDIVAVGRVIGINGSSVGLIAKFDGKTGLLEAGFAKNGYSTFTGYGFGSVVEASDGSLLVLSNEMTSALARFLPDGHLAAGFAQGGWRQFGGGALTDFTVPSAQLAVSGDAAYVVYLGANPVKAVSVAKVYLGDNDLIFADGFENTKP